MLRRVVVARRRVERVEKRYLIVGLRARRGAVNAMERLAIILIYVKLKYNALYCFIVL
jgi:hypothetical protein